MSVPRITRRVRFRPAVLVVLVAVILAPHPVVAQAAPQSLSARREQALRVRSQIAALDQQLEIVVERYNQANEALALTGQAVRDTQTDLVRTRRRLRVRQAALARRVEGMYRAGDVGFVDVVLATSDFMDFLERMDMLTRIGDADAETVAEIKVAKKALERRKRDLAAQLAERKVVAAQVSADKEAIESRLAERERMLAGIKDEIAALEREEAARQAEIQRKARARLSGSASADRRYRPTGDPHLDVVQVAMAQLGKPYRYGAAGPDAFDCSGLTMYCYAQVGISLPHHSASQYGVGEKVGRFELAPGDLVFFGSPIHHVGIYIGSDQYIHAPHTGAVVRIDSLSSRSDFVGGARP